MPWKKADIQIKSLNYQKMEEIHCGNTKIVSSNDNQLLVSTALTIPFHNFWYLLVIKFFIICAPLILQINS